MLLRRISQHIKAQNWFAVFLDFFIVVVGVFIGIQVANWNAKQGEIKIAKDSLDRIQEELAINRVALELWLDNYELLSAYALSTLSGLNRPVDERGMQFLRDAYQATSFARFTLPRNAYNDLISLGAPKAHVDQEVRRSLANYYFFLDMMAGNLQNVPEYRSLLRRNLPYDIQITIREACQPKVNILELSMSLSEDCQPDLSEDQIKRAFAGLSNVDLKPELNLTLNDLMLKIGIIRLALNASQELDNIIETNK
jgi:hypothetical protein